MKRKYTLCNHTVAAMVRAVAKTFKGVFHISEIKNAVLRILPEAKIETIQSAVWNLVHKFGYLESPKRFHYQIKA